MVQRCAANRRKPDAASAFWGMGENLPIFRDCLWLANNSAWPSCNLAMDNFRTGDAAGGVAGIDHQL